MGDMEAQNTEIVSEHEGEVDGTVVLNYKVDRPITLKFEDIVYKIKLQQPSGCSSMMMNNQKREEKMILKGISGVVRPGEMLAMLGPSGSGKTTLLTALGGRLEGGGQLEGAVSYNGKPFSRTLIKRSMGFVTQDDILYEHLTVRETLVYTALLRLPNNFSKEEKVGQAEGVIAKLGLSICKDNIIGGGLVRGISGGERKRVSIGQEMLINPKLLFLDEPTSGLDSTTAQKIVGTVVEVATKARTTVVMTIHQPSSRLFYLFHKVLLLCDGSPLYFGSGERVMDYFGSIGFAPSIAMNPADFLLDLANGIFESPDENDDQTNIKRKLVLAYKQNLDEIVKSEMVCQLEEQSQRERDGKHNDHNSKQQIVKRKWVTTWWQQFCVLLQRDVKERKHESFSALNIFQISFTAIITSLLWFKSDPSHIQDHVGLMFFYLTFWGYTALFQAIFKFPTERLMLAKERSSGMYRLSSYFMARVVGDLPMELVLPTAYLTVIYWMTGLKPTPFSFFLNLLSLLLHVLVCQGLGLALGALFLDQKKATILASIVMLTFMLAGGFYVQNVPSFIAWVKYLSLTQYTFRLMLNSQYSWGDTYPCDQAQHATASTASPSICLVRDFPMVKTVGLNGQPTAFLVLILMLLGYRLIAYMALMRIGAPPN